jgi:hypothetical protein
VPVLTGALRLLDHLVGDGQQRFRHLDAQRLGGLEIDHQARWSNRRTCRQID